MTLETSLSIRTALALLSDPVIGPCFGHWLTPDSGTVQPVKLLKCPEAGGGPALFVLVGNLGAAPTVLHRVAFGLN